MCCAGKKPRTEDFANRSISSSQQAWEFIHAPISLSVAHANPSQVAERLKTMLTLHLNYRVAAFAQWAQLAQTIDPNATFESAKTDHVGSTIGDTRLFVQVGDHYVEEVIKWTAAHSSPLPDT